MASWVKGYSPDLISRRIERAKTVSNDGRVSFVNFEYSEYLVLLNSMIEVHAVVPQFEKQRIIRKATFEAGAKGDISAKSILREVDRLESAYLSGVERKYRLITDVSISPWCKIPRVDFERSRIVVHARLNNRARTSRNRLLVEARHSLTNDPPINYAPVSVSIRARSSSEAAEVALDRLDFIRGLWNLWNNRGRQSRRSSGTRRPANAIILGPLHTLHNDDGSLATESWWYDPQYQGAVSLFDKRRKIDSMSRFTRDLRRRLQKIPYTRDIALAVVRYVQALDTRDWDVAFLRLWGVLEYLTGTTRSDSHKVTVRRASYMFSDRDYVHQVLSHLKDYRNNSVHAGSASTDIESLMYQLKRYVETLIEFHIANRYHFASRADAAEFMDLPYDENSINRKTKMLRYARKFISGS